MELTGYLAIAVLTIGLVYLAISLISHLRSRGRRTGDVGKSAAEMMLNMGGDILVEGEPTYQRMQKLGGICATVVRRIFDEDLDFSVESIARLDRSILKGWGESTDDVLPDVILSFGAYIGEVMVRHTSGRWVSSMSEEIPAEVLFLRKGKDLEPVSVSPFLMVEEKFRKMYKWDLGIAYTALEQKLKELSAV